MSGRAALERLAAAIGLLCLSPVIAAAAAAILIESGRPVLFRQIRVGRDGRPFRLLKLRSMLSGASGRQVTAAGDPRISRVGALLRRYKLDELPQLWNILRGDMQLIGPRPELPLYVDMQDPLWRAALRQKPGLTDLSTLVYRNEEEVLSRWTDPERGYREEVLPRKLALSVAYGRVRGLRTDLKLIALTARYSFIPSGFDPEKILNTFQEHA